MVDVYWCGLYPNSFVNALDEFGFFELALFVVFGC